MFCRIWTSHLNPPLITLTGEIWSTEFHIKQIWLQERTVHSQTLLPQVYLKGRSPDKGYMLFISKIWQTSTVHSSGPTKPDRDWGKPQISDLGYPVFGPRFDPGPPKYKAGNPSTQQQCQCLLCNNVKIYVLYTYCMLHIISIQKYSLKIKLS